ncbi:Smc5-Smc6 Complex Localization Factor Protein 1 [Manis pentadactyla]|nr:Smc5-Smc6 Complex Localization Factor Protein 1 [Manis pentadactyla]
MKIQKTEEATDEMKFPMRAETNPELRPTALKLGSFRLRNLLKPRANVHAEGAHLMLANQRRRDEGIRWVVWILGPHTLICLPLLKAKLHARIRMPRCSGAQVQPWGRSAEEDSSHSPLRHGRPSRWKPGASSPQGQRQVLPVSDLVPELVTSTALQTQPKWDTVRGSFRKIQINTAQACTTGAGKDSWLKR